eukprot:CAMPEP_0179361752 /NCGR_PEP_ID=MMETSP0797-20121207/80664_1 /TAXON_ID=47934 /ORGANISM="Dinophysis acuminata, Strain DAEP01" /LENGTH=388 /DNA_ID=CAMNT_0021077167 /DNA_START=64 /DNA_END=1230 /DNA_ORIENTATION=-
MRLLERCANLGDHAVTLSASRSQDAAVAVGVVLAVGVRGAGAVGVVPRPPVAAAVVLVVVLPAAVVLAAAPEDAAAGQDALPLPLPPDARPVPAPLLRPLHDLAHDARGVVALPALPDRGREVLAVEIRHGLGVALGDDVLCNLAEQVRVGRYELLAGSCGHEKLVAYAEDLLGEEVVEDAVAADDDDVSLVERDAVHRAAFLDDFDRHALVEVGVELFVQPAYLQRALGVAVDPLHLGVEYYLVGLLPAVQLAQDQELAVAHAEHGDHRVQLAVDLRAVVQDGDARRGGPEGLRRLEGVPVRDELRHGQGLAGPEQLDRQLRRVQAHLLDLGHPVGDAEEHGGHEGSICVLVPIPRLPGVGLLVGVAAETEGLVLVVLLRKVLFAAL